MQASHAWYERRFGIRIPVVLAVLDTEMYNKAFDLISTREAPTQEKPRLIAITDRPSGPGPAGADRDHANGGVLQGEHILFHDDGHAFFDAMNIGDIGAAPTKSTGFLEAHNRTIVEFVASVFAIAYIRSERPDLNFILEDRRSRSPKAPRYRTFADLDYLNNGIDGPTYFWFMFQMEKLADAVLAKHPDFPAAIRKAKLAFQDHTKPFPPEVIWARFETIWPGFKEMAGLLASPTSIQSVAAASCEEPAVKGNWSRIVIINESAHPIAVRPIPGDTPQAVQEHSWRTFNLGVRALLLQDGKCVPARNEPSVFISGRE